jgi:hypothetical protein
LTPTLSEPLHRIAQHLGSAQDMLSLSIFPSQCATTNDPGGLRAEWRFPNLLLWMPLGLQGISDRLDM